jgi:hypothetical protein
MPPIEFDVTRPDLAMVRKIVLRRLREEKDWRHLDYDGRGFAPYVLLVPPRPSDHEIFAFLALDVFWELFLEGVVAPGFNASNPNLPFFHVTQYGRIVLQTGEYQPHDREGYLARLTHGVSVPDATVMAYLEEGLETFARGTLVASMVMLGVAAERVFDLLCTSMAPALVDKSEAATFRKLLDRFAMKPKVDWVHDKLCTIQESRPRPDGFPENATLAVTAIYDLIRSQRNDLGHPRDLPPRLSREEIHTNLLIFPRYYETAESIRRFLESHKI